MVGEMYRIAGSPNAHTWACLCKTAGMTSFDGGAIRVRRYAYPPVPMLVILVGIKGWSVTANQ